MVLQLFVVILQIPIVLQLLVVILQFPMVLQLDTNVRVSVYLT